MTRHTLLRVFAGAFALAAAWALSLPAQGSAQGCDEAAKIIARGHPTKTQDWAYNAVAGCGAAGGRAVATGLQRYANETDVAALEDFMAQVDNWRDATVFQAALRLATNSAASPQVRVFAVRHLIVILQPNMLFTYAGLTKGSDTTRTPEAVMWTVGCPAQMVSHGHGMIRGAPLPTDYETRIRSTLKSLSESSSTPMPVRSAAKCVFPPS